MSPYTPFDLSRRCRVSPGFLQKYEYFSIGETLQAGKESEGVKVHLVNIPKGAQ
jgi:hypothetical protein